MPRGSCRLGSREGLAWPSPRHLVCVEKFPFPCLTSRRPSKRWPPSERRAPSRSLWRTRRRDDAEITRDYPRLPELTRSWWRTRRCSTVRTVQQRRQRRSRVRRRQRSRQRRRHGRQSLQRRQRSPQRRQGSGVRAVRRPRFPLHLARLESGSAPRRRAAGDRPAPRRGTRILLAHPALERTRGHVLHCIPLHPTVPTVLPSPCLHAVL